MHEGEMSFSHSPSFLINELSIMSNQSSFAGILSQANLQYAESSIWLEQKARSESILSGWKLHVSANGSSAHLALLKVIGVLDGFPSATFKCCKDLIALEKLNLGEYGDTQRGKFITIYPWLQSEALELAEKLHHALADHQDYPSINAELALGNGIYARYGCFTAQDLRDDKTGIKALPLIKLPNGDIVEDARGSIPSSCIEANPFSGSHVFAERIKKSIKDLNDEYPGDLYASNLVPIGKLKSGLYQCLGESLDSGEQVLKIAKVASRADVQGCQNLSKIFQFYELLGGSGLAPNSAALVNGLSDFILVCDFIGGVTFREVTEEISGVAPFWELGLADQKSIQEILLKVVVAIKRMHQLGVVHCDLSPNNIILTNQETIAFIDFETAIHLDRCDDKSLYGFELPKATNGYYLPGHQYSSVQSVDVYSFGALLLELIYRISPMRLGQSIEDEEFIETIFNPFQSLAREIINIMLKSDAIEDYMPVLKSLKARAKVLPSSARNFREINIANVDHALARSFQCLAGLQLPSKMWNTFHESDYNNSVVDGSYNHGNSGIFLYVAKASVYLRLKSSSPDPEELINRLLGYEQFGDKNVCGLHFGFPGLAFGALKIAEICPDISAGALDELMQKVVDISSNPRAFNGFDITHGLAGKIQLLVQASRVRPSLAVNQAIHDTAKAICKGQLPNGSWPQVNLEDDDKSLLGFGHGAAGITFALASAYELVRDHQIIECIQRSVHFIFSNIVEENGGLRLAGLLGSFTSHWWCRGEAGVLLSLLKIASTFEDDAFYDYACKMTPFTDCSVSALSSNLSQCHGMAGLGESYLSLYAFRKDPVWISRAGEIAAIISSLMTVPDDDLGMMTNTIQSGVNPSLMTGFTGQSHFLLRYKMLLESDIDIGHPAL